MKTAMKEIEVIPLAQRKADRRGIRKEWIDDTVCHSERLAEGYGGRKVAQKKFLLEGKEYLLRVVYEETEDKYVVVTAYLTSQLSRYWKEEE